MMDDDFLRFVDRVGIEICSWVTTGPNDPEHFWVFDDYGRHHWGPLIPLRELRNIDGSSLEAGGCSSAYTHFPRAVLWLSSTTSTTRINNKRFDFIVLHLNGRISRESN
jgi:hypothetical protein